MTRFVVRRLASMVGVMFAVSVLTFMIFNVIPNGDPAVRMAGKTPSRAEVEAIRREWGFDRPLPVQYATSMRKVLSGDVVSYFTRLDVTDEIARAAPRTFALAIGAAALSIVLGVGLGLLSAARPGGVADRALGAATVVGISMPVFWLGALMSHYLGFRAGLFPNGGYVPLVEDPLGWAHHLAMPWAALSLLLVGFYSRVVKASLLETAADDHVLAARARGLPERRILAGHVLRNSLVPLLAVWGLDFGALLGGGAILTEVVFDLQGVGQYAAEAIGQLDVPPVLAVTLFGAFFIVALNALVDILQAALDPRIRLA